MKLLFTKMKTTVREGGFCGAEAGKIRSLLLHMLSLRHLYLLKWRTLIGSWVYKTEIQEITLGVTGIWYHPYGRK